MKYFITIYFTILFTAALFAQAPDTLWTKTFGGNETDWGYSVQQTTDDGYIITGLTYSYGAGKSDVWLIKTDANGDTIWTKTFGDSLSDQGRSVQQTADGGFIITGYTYSFGAGGRDVWLIKTDAHGNILWNETFGGSTEDLGLFVQQTLDGGYIITGLTYSYGAGKSDVWLIKTDANGDTIWTKTFGDSLYDSGTSVQQTSDGGYIITGNTEGTGRYIPGHGWLIKTDANGDTLWTKTFGRCCMGRGNSVQQTSDGGYIITGTIGLIKTDANGDTLWTKTFGGRWGNSVQQASDGGYIIIITGTILGLIKTKTNGDTLWTKPSEGWLGYSVQQTSDGGYIIAGRTSGHDVLLIKVAPDVTSISENSQASISGYELKQNYPNPFNPITTIKYQIPELSFVTLKVYDVLGSEITTLVNEEKSVGSYEVDFKATGLSSGIYFYQLTAGSLVETKKMLLLK